MNFFNMKYSVLFLLLFTQCNPKEALYTPVPYHLEIPLLFQEKLIPPLIPIDNQLTNDGVALGKKLFFDPRLSKNNKISCASCHAPKNAFTENTSFSEGVDGMIGTRNAMPLFNLAWNFSERFAWDGKEFGLEQQVIDPVSSPIEMNSNWEDVVEKLQKDSEYPTLFLNAFGTTIIQRSLVTKAIAQFERTLISGNSKFDYYLRGEATLTNQELNGFNLFMDETKGDCFHCHGSPNNPLWTDNDFHNNGLDAEFTDLGLGAISGKPNDNGKFKTPSLRNLIYTAPYMHDGRFSTLEAVINHYSEGLQNSETIDPLMKKVAQGGVGLSESEKAALKAFLESLSDPTFIESHNVQ